MQTQLDLLIEGLEVLVDGYNGSENPSEDHAELLLSLAKEIKRIYEPEEL